MRDKAAAVAAANLVEGCMPVEELAQIADLLPDVPSPRVLETGAWKGRTTTLFHKLGAIVFTVDDWSGAWVVPDADRHHPRFLEQFLFNTDSAITPLKANTIANHDELLTAVRLLFSVRKADMVFIDSNHSKTAVLCDLALAAAAIREGGVLAGHDIDLPGVREAVDEVVGPDKWVALGPRLWRRK